MGNYKYAKSSLSEITKETFKEAIFLCYKDGITSLAPLGFSGDTIILHGSKSADVSRISQVSIRNYSGDAELLITDRKGHFLFYGRFSVDLGLDLLADQYWLIYNTVKDKICSVVERTSQFKDMEIPENVDRTIGFEMLYAYQRSKP